MHPISINLQILTLPQKKGNLLELVNQPDAIVSTLFHILQTQTCTVKGPGADHPLIPL